MVTILNEFTSPLGQKINLTKYGPIFGSNIDMGLRRVLADIINVPLWDHPGAYLGIPEEWGGSKVLILQWIKEKVLSKMEGWKGNLLNKDGK